MEIGWPMGDPKLRVTKTCCHKSTYLHKNEVWNFFPMNVLLKTFVKF
jgi:hypothetical protein